MNGIVFFRTLDLRRLRAFYLDRIGAELWLDQGDCLIVRHGNFLFGFCQRDRVDTCGMLTFYFETRDLVDVMYDRLQDIATTTPTENAKYHIYQFFAEDPDGRALEFQFFDHPLPA